MQNNLIFTLLQLSFAISAMSTWRTPKIIYCVANGRNTKLFVDKELVVWILRMLPNNLFEHFEKAK